MKISQKITNQFFCLILLLVLLISCSDDIQRETINLGHTAKVEYISEKLIIDEINYQWYFSNKPDNSQPILFVEGDKALFTPDVGGDYDIVVSVINNSDQELDQIVFHYSVVGPEKFVEEKITESLDQEEISIKRTDEVIDIPVDNQPENKKITKPVQKSSQSESAPIDEKVIVKQKSVKKISPPPKTQSVKRQPSKTGLNYTVQVSSWQNRTAAQADYDRYDALGFPVYIQEEYSNKLLKNVYRVRVGEYENRHQAELTGNKLSKYTESGKVWITTMSPNF